MKIKLLVILLAHSLISMAQSDKVQISDLVPYVDKNAAELDKDHFPEIKYTNKKAAEKINTFLQIEYLEHVPGVYKINPFEKVSYDKDNCCSYVNFQGWKKETTPKNILCLEIEGEASGAYPEYFANYRSFDLTTANPILLKKLLLSSKTSELSKLLTQKADMEINNYLKEIKDSLANPKLNKEDRERYGEQDTLYRNCLNDHKDVTIDYYDFYFTKDSITFVLGRCSIHAMRSLDDLYDYLLPMSYTDLTPYLSPYGKSLLKPESKATVSSDTPEGKLFKGTIGNIPVTLIINEINKDYSFSSTYWYDKHKIPIDLSSSYIDGHLSFKEYAGESNSPTATIEAVWVDNHKIIGVWWNVLTGKKLKVVLETY